MLISLKHRLLAKKITASKIILRYSPLILPAFAALIFSSWGSAATTTNNPFPPTLSPNIENSNSDGINTSEYVIIRPSEEATFSSETTASIDTLNVKEGSTFHKGDILLKLDCRLQQADLDKAKAQQQATSKALDSAKKLKSYGSISEFELVKASSDAKSANADVDKLSVIVEKCEIIAPFNGSVSELKVHPFETVKPGDPLLKVVNTDDLTFEIQIPSTWLEWLHIGSVFNVHINDVDKDITAKVTLINPEIEPVSQTVKIIGVITPSNPNLRPGMSGQASFVDNPANKKAKS